MHIMQKMEFDMDIDKNVIGKTIKLLSNRSKTLISPLQEGYNMKIIKLREHPNYGFVGLYVSISLHTHTHRDTRTHILVLFLWFVLFCFQCQLIR